MNDTATTPAVIPPADLSEECPAVLAWANALVVATPDDMAAAAERLTAIKTMAKRVDEFFRPIKQSADAHKRAILDAEKKLAGPLAEAERKAKAAMVAYTDAVEERRQAEERRLQAEADARARREREALEAKAAAAKRPETQQKYAEAATAVAAPVVRVASPIAKANGVSTRKVWRHRVKDAGLVPREFLIVDDKKLAAYAAAMKEGARVPGVEFFTETIMSASGR